MKILKKRWQLVIYACSGLGLNMINMIMGVHLCNALIRDGFDSNVEYWTYENRTLVVVGLWMALSVVVKALDGVVDIPLSAFTDNLRTRWGRRRPAIVMGYIPLLISYVLFLFPIDHSATLVNTLWFVSLLGIFYASYTLTMLTWYATFAEIVDNDRDRVFLSTMKSVCDVVYFSLNFAVVPLLVNMQVNIRYVALIFLPLAFTMLIPLFMIKEDSTKEGPQSNGTAVKNDRVGMFQSLKFAFSNRSFVFWLCCVAVMNTGLQLFLGGISVFFSNIGDGLDMTLIMASSFAPVPFTLILYNKIVKKYGLKTAFQYILLVFSVGMSLMMLCHVVSPSAQLPIAIMCALIVSFAIGAFFSISYTVPSQLAADENKKMGAAVSSTMYFAVQGLAEAISASLATQVLLVFIRTFASESETESGPLVKFFPLFVSAFCMLAFVMAFFLPKAISSIGKEQPAGKDTPTV